MPTIDNWRNTLMRAAINCQHRITSESVSLAQSDEQSDGNALAQLADRLGEAVKPLLDERDRLAAEVEALRADAGRFALRIEEAFMAGFGSPETYNDTLINTADEAWKAWREELLSDAAMKGKP